MINKNELLNIFSNTFQIERQEMQDYFIKNSHDNFEIICKELEDMRVNLFDFIWKETEPNLTLTSTEIITLSEKYLQENYSWIDETGIKSVNSHILWICWHEGILKSETK